MGPARHAFRLRLALLTAVLGVAGIMGWERHLGENAIAETPLIRYTPASLAQRVHRLRGRPLLLVLYPPDPDGATLAADLRRWATQVTPRLETIALAVGDRRDAQYLFRYGAEEGVQRLPPEWLERSEPGTLERTMAELGVITTDEVSPPLIAVFDPEGKVTAQWEGTADYVEVLAAAKAARSPAPAGDSRN